MSQHVSPSIRPSYRQYTNFNVLCIVHEKLVYETKWRGMPTCYATLTRAAALPMSHGVTMRA
jgi:hypothetical protein